MFDFLMLGQQAILPSFSSYLNSNSIVELLSGLSDFPKVLFQFSFTRSATPDTRKSGLR